MAQALLHASYEILQDAEAHLYAPGQSFSTNIRSLAYAEMRLVLTKVLFNFDLELVDKDVDWMAGQKVFTLWEKPSLMVKLTPVKHPLRDGAHVSQG